MDAVLNVRREVKRLFIIGAAIAIGLAFAGMHFEHQSGPSAPTINLPAASLIAGGCPGGSPGRQPTLPRRP